MAIITTRVSDLSGASGEDITTVVVALNGAEYEVDLTAKELETLEKALDKYFKVGRRSIRRSPASKASGGTGDAKEVRAWLVANGYDVPTRGRIPAEMREAYESKKPA